jgi:predicted nucleic acid-binding protein
VIADTTFLSHWSDEMAARVVGPARVFMARHRNDPLRTTIISVAEASVVFPSAEQGWAYFESRRWRIYRLNDGIAKAATDLDRHLSGTGRRFGENDNWIAGFALYYREPLVSLDLAFDRVPGLRRLAY